MSAPVDCQIENTPAGPTVEVLEKCTNDGDASRIVKAARSQRKPPAVLCDLPAWVCWRYEDRDGKQIKRPYYANGGTRSGSHGNPRDIAQLTTFDVACKAAASKGFTGVGFATLPQFGITALDFDHCVTAQGVSPEVEGLVAGTYAEYSPSGTGVRAFVVGSVDANRKSHATATQWGLEFFSTKGFVTYTGNVLEITELTGSENTVAPISLPLKDEYVKRFGDGNAGQADAQPLGLSHDHLRQALGAIDPDMGYSDWLSVGMAIHHETGADADALELWIDWSSHGTKFPGREALESRWDGFGHNGDGGTVTAGP